MRWQLDDKKAFGEVVAIAGRLATEERLIRKARSSRIKEEISK